MPPQLRRIVHDSIERQRRQRSLSVQPSKRRYPAYGEFPWPVRCPAARSDRIASSRPSQFSRDHKCSKARVTSWWKQARYTMMKESLRLAATLGRVCHGRAALSCILALFGTTTEFMNVSEVQPRMTGYAKPSSTVRLLIPSRPKCPGCRRTAPVRRLSPCGFSEPH